jgi:hypothetical protein
VGWAVFAEVGLVMAVVAAIVIVFAVIEGAEERRVSHGRWLSRCLVNFSVEVERVHCGPSLRASRCQATARTASRHQQLELHV